MGDTSHLKHKEIDPAALAAGYVQQLTKHPLDNEVREKLALLYAEHYQRPDLAGMELEPTCPATHQPAGRSFAA